MSEDRTGFADQPPSDEGVTDYDRRHATLYLRLLDAAGEGADPNEIARVLFGLDPRREPDRARQVHDSHLARARWITEWGYWSLIRGGTA